MRSKAVKPMKKSKKALKSLNKWPPLIAKDYQQFVADDLDDLDIELSIAKQSIKRDNE